MTGSTEVVQLPDAFLARPEFQPRAPLPEGGASVWLPLHPEFAFRGPAEPAAAPPRQPPLREVLSGLARRWGIEYGARAVENLARLDDPLCRLVITGQQPGFLGGPLFTIYKAISAVAAARNLERATGRPHAPVFWVAGEDHDLDEARAARFPGEGGETAAVELPHRADRRPLSAYPIDREVLAAVGRAREHLLGRRCSDDIEVLFSCYSEGRNLASAFGALMADLFAPWGLLLIEPGALRAAAVPVIRRVLEDPAGLMERIGEGIARIERLGIKAQVPARFPLFLLEPGEAGRRHHLEPAAGGFAIGDGSGALSAAAALDLLEKSPERFSPGVLLRPVVQEALLPVAAAIGGPAEAAYFGQLGPVFEHLGAPRTPLALRLSATLIEGKVARALRRLGIDPGSPDRLARAGRPEDLAAPEGETAPERLLRELRRDAARRLEEAIAAARLPAPQAENLRAGAEKLAGDLDRLGARLRRAEAARSEEDLQAARAVWSHLFPGGDLQERRWNVLHYLAKYGRAWIAGLVAELERDPFTPAHRWAYLSGRED